MTSSTTPLWRHVARESVLGNRGLTKSVMLLLPWAVFRTLAKDGGVRGGGTAGFFALLAANVCWTLCCILANDLVDRDEDIAAGKRRWIARLPAAPAAALVLAVFGAGATVLAAAHGPAGALLTYAAACVLGLLYSLPPVRTKERGAWGLVLYGLAATAGYVVLPWTRLGGEPGILAALAAAVFLDKWVNLHFHQVIDHGADAAQGTRTYAVRAGAARAAATLRAVSLVAAIWFAAATLLVSSALPAFWKWLLPAAAALVLCGSAWYSACAGRKGAQGSSLVRQLPVWYLGMSYALFRAIPLLLMSRLVLADPSLWPVAAAAALLVGAEAFFVYSYRYA